MAESGEAAVGTWAPERRIAVAVDEGEESVYALRWCLRHVLLGNSHNSTVILLYARPPPPVYPSLDGTDLAGKRHGSYDIEANFVPNLELPDTGYSLFSDDVITTVEKYSKDLADSVMERAKGVCRDYNHIKVEARVATGDARDVICNMVEKSFPRERQRLLRAPRRVPGADRETPVTLVITPSLHLHGDEWTTHPL